MNEENIVVVDENGNEIEMQILFTFEGDPTPEGKPGKAYVLYFNPEEEEEGTVYASSYTEEGLLEPVEDEKEWEMIEEVFATFMSDDEDHEHND